MSLGILKEIFMGGVVDAGDFGICFEMENSGERGRGKRQKTEGKKKKKNSGTKLSFKMKLVGFKKF